MLVRVCLDCGAFYGRGSGSRCPTCRSREKVRRNRADANNEYHRGAEHRARRKRVLARDQHTCRWCGGPATSVDYVVPLALGGARDDGNAVAACQSCNSRRGGGVRRGVVESPGLAP